MIKDFVLHFLSSPNYPVFWSKKVGNIIPQLSRNQNPSWNQYIPNHVFTYIIYGLVYIYVVEFYSCWLGNSRR